MKPLSKPNVPVLRPSALAGAVVMGLVAATTAQAAPISDEVGFSGDITPLVGVLTSRSNLVVSSDRKEIDSLYSLSSRDTRLVGGVLGQIDYTLTPNRLAVYAGTPRQGLVDGDPSLEVGARYRISGVGLLQAGVIPVTFAGNEAWADPFLTGEKRQATDVDTRGLNLGLSGIAGTGLGVSYRLLRRDYDQEQSGQALNLSAAERSRLDRNVTEHRLGVDYRLTVGDNFSLTPGIRYRRMDVDGAANRGWLLRPQLSARWTSRQWQLSLTGYYGVDRYEARQPIFDEYRDGHEKGLVAGVRYTEPFGWANWSVNAYGVYSERDSDIRFYDQQTGLFAVGLGYRF